MAEPVTVTFEDEEQAVLRFLADIFHKGNNRCVFREIPLPEKCDEQWRDKTLQRFANYGLVKWQTTAHIEIKPKLLEVVDKLNNPKKPNYWKKTLEWWFASRWRAAITIAVVILPLLVQWVEMIRTVLKWIGTSAG